MRDIADRLNRLLPAIPMLAALIPCATHAEPLPADSGIVNVRDYGARGNGKDDDTAALLKAIAASGDDTGRTFWQDRIVYIPDGTYKVSGTLLKRYANGGFASGLILVGQSQAHTILRLADHAPGFGDPTQPRAVIFTSSKLLDGTATSGGKNYTALGEGNDAYMNSVEDMTIDVGSGDPGAIGIDYLANNIGDIRDVTLRAAPDSGATGLSMIRKWPGPALIQNLNIQGFGVGIATAQTEYGLTFDHVSLAGQRYAGIRNSQNALSMRDVHIAGPATPIVNEGDEGFIAIDGVKLDGRDGGEDVASAIENTGMVTIRNVGIGSQESQSNSKSGLLSGTLQGRSQWTSKAPPTWLPPPAEAPPIPNLPPGQWTNVVKFGAVPDPNQDSTEGLRRAFASGASVVYLPHGAYAISDTIDVPANVRRIVGMGSTIRVFHQRNPGFSRVNGMLRVSTSGPPVSIERLAFDNTNLGMQLAIEVAAGRDVTLRDIVSAGVTLVDRKAEGGRVFIEDTCCGRISLAGPKPVYAEQLDTEGAGVRILDLGTPLRVLGLKTEGVCTVVDNRQGARTDIFGGLLYVVRDGAGPDVPAFHNAQSWLSASFAEESLRNASHYSVYVANESAAGAQNAMAGDFPQRRLGRFVAGLTAAP